MTEEAIFVLRHGEREDYVDPNWNKKHPNLASDDPPLAQKGHVQANEATGRLVTERIDFIFTSPYQRCVETANYIAEAINKPIFIEPGICEVMHQFPPGYQTTAQLKQRFSRIDISYAPTLIPQQCEPTDGDCIRRVIPCARAIRERYKGNRLLFVGHGASVAAILSAFTGTIGYVGLCTVSKIVNTATLNGPLWKAECIGDSSHLSDKSNLRAY